MKSQQTKKKMDTTPLCLGVACDGGYYEFGAHNKVSTKKTKDIPVGTFIKPDFTPLTHQEIADFFSITKEEWLSIWLGFQEYKMEINNKFNLGDNVSFGPYICKVIGLIVKPGGPIILYEISYFDQDGKYSSAIVYEFELNQSHTSIGFKTKSD